MAFSGDLEVAAFADAYQRLALAVANAVPPKESPFAALLRDHLGRDTDDLSVVAMELDTFEQPNLQRAIDAYTATDDVVVGRVVGMRGQYRMYGGLTLSMLTTGQMNMEIGPVDYIERPVDVDATETCTDFGLFLLSVRGTPVAMLVRGADERVGRMTNVNVEVMAVDRDDAKGVLGDLRTLMSVHNV